MDTSSAGYTKTSVGQDQIGLGVASNINQMVSILLLSHHNQLHPLQLCITSAEVTHLPHLLLLMIPSDYPACTLQLPHKKILIPLTQNETTTDQKWIIKNLYKLYTFSILA